MLSVVIFFVYLFLCLRCSRWCLRSQWYFFRTSTAMSPHHAYLGSQTSTRQHSTAVIRVDPYTRCVCYNPLSSWDTTNRYIPRHSRCSIHSMSFLNIQKKVKTKLPGEDSVPEGEELGSGKTYGDKPVRNSELPCNTKPNVSDGVPGAGVDIGAKIISESETITENRKSTPRTEQIPPPQEDVASHSLEKKDKDVRIMEKEQLPSSKVQRYFLWRYSWYLNRFQESLKQEMPDTFKMFHIFTVGVKEFVIDFRYVILSI